MTQEGLITMTELQRSPEILMFMVRRVNKDI